MDNYIIALGTCFEREPVGTPWEAGDPVIQEGIYQLLPELEQLKVIPSERIGVNLDVIDSYVKNAAYIIQMGSPSWMNARYRLFWRAAAKYKKRIALIGIGMALPYCADFWYGREDVIYLKDSGCLDLVVCRDKFCYYWLTNKSGFESSYTHVLPCPAFYVFEPRKIASKHKVVLALPNAEETSCSLPTTLKDYYAKFDYLISELEGRGAEIFLAYHRAASNHPGYMEELKRHYPDHPVRDFTHFKEYAGFHSDKDVYIGVRNHGALPCAGSGMPSLLLGTDYRQYLADEIPFMSRMDISHNSILARPILDWYFCLAPVTISESLVRWRQVTYDRWREILSPVRKTLKDLLPRT